MRKRRQTGFTLIELLVVIAIIAILAAILFPVFAKARESARKASCLSNLKQLGMATMMYADDHDETYPYFFYVPSMAWPGVNLVAPLSGPNLYDGGLWIAKLLPYTKNGQLGFCMSVAKDPPDHWVDPTTGHAPTNYSINAMVVMPDYWPAMNPAKFGNVPPGPCTIGKVKNPTATFIWEDWGQAYSGGATHMGGTNFVCCDGHAKWLKDLGGIKGNQTSIANNYYAQGWYDKATQ